ncbi:Fic family protein [Roseibium alexandrii]
MVKFLVETGGLSETGCRLSPTSKALKELHRTGTLFLLEHPGEYRTKEVHIGNGEVVVHKPPTCEEVEPLIDDFFHDLHINWPNYEPIDACAYALWRINWIHPFVNGNGRTARAFSYACLCLKFGFILPGTNTVTDLIMANRERFCAALKSVDESYDKGKLNLNDLTDFLTDLLIQQLESMPDT